MLGVDVIEAGFPAASEGDFEAVKAIAQSVENAQVAGLARANAKDIDRAWEAVKFARNPRIHTSSPLPPSTWNTSCARLPTKSWISPSPP